MPPVRREAGLGQSVAPEITQPQQDVLFKTEELLTLEEFAAHVAVERNQHVPLSTNPEQVASEDISRTESRSPRKQGAFGGAIKRRIEQTNSAEKYAATNEVDIKLLTPLSIQRELFTGWGDQSFRGVVLTPKELKAVTFSPETLSKRIGSQVLAGTVGRPATNRHARKAEVVMEGLQSRGAKADEVLATLKTDEQVFQTLAKEMKSPGYAHMSGEHMDSLMAHAEKVFISMFEAITTNHGAGTERVESLTAALNYLLSGDDYRKTFSYWRHMVNTGTDWTRAKYARFEVIRAEIDKEITVRS